MSESKQQQQQQASGRQYLLFCVDSTGSMGAWIAALNAILPEVMDMVALTGCFERMAVIAYGDYDKDWENRPVKWSGWESSSAESLRSFAAAMRPTGGGGEPEAVKSALIFMSKNMPPCDQPGDRVHVLHITDASCHVEVPGRQLDSEGKLEKAELGDMFDFVKICKMLSALPVTYSCVCTVRDFKAYNIIAAFTGGHVHKLNGFAQIPAARKALMSVLNLWMDCDQPNSPHYTAVDPIVVTVCDRSVLHLMDQESTMLKHNKEVHITQDELAQNLKRDVLANSVANCVARVKQDPEFFDYVYERLKRVVEHSVMALCSNVVLGRLWRAFCERRKDSRRDELLALLSQAKERLAAEDRQELEQWNRESYNASAEIREDLVEFSAAYPELRGVIRYNGDDEFHPHDIMNTFTACMKTDQAQVIKVLARLSIDTESRWPTLSGEDAGNDELPLHLPPNQLFSLILHLAAPGCKVSLRPSCILACLALRSQCVLKAQAEQLLAESRGKWLNFKRREDGVTPEISEHYNPNILYLVLSTHKAGIAASEGSFSVLTDEELKTIEHLLHVQRAVSTANSLVTFSVRSADVSAGIYRDYIVVCKECGRERPLSLIAADGRCGYCHYNCSMDVASWNDDKSYQTECFNRDCCGTYARLADTKLRVNKPKCYSCKIEHKPSPHVKCSKCGFRFVTYHGFPKGATECAVCASGDAPRKMRLDEHSVSVRTLFEGKFGVLYALAGLDSKEGDQEVRGSVVNASLVLSERKSDEPVAQGNRTLIFNAQYVDEPSKVWDHVVNLMTGRSHAALPNCAVCCDQKQPQMLLSVCGRRGCQQKVCNDCGLQWYTALRPGTVINTRHLYCPFCSRLPSGQTMRRWNPRAATLGAMDAMAPQNYYAWCITCNRARECGDRNCAAQPPRLENFECAECVQNRARNVQLAVAGGNDVHGRTLLCPKCGVPTSKVSGCNHITCPCGQHWCFECGKGCDDAMSTYNHMQSVHGRMYEDEAAMFRDEGDDD